MATPPLSIRNFTSAPLKLKVIERYRSPTSKHITGIGSYPTSAAPSSGQLAANAQSFAREDVDTRIEPFVKHNSDINIADRSHDETLRLTFECDGQRYRIDTPTMANASQTLVGLSSDAKRELTAVFLHDASFMAIYSSLDLACWMKHLSDVTPLSALSIPGTHNSPTCHKALPSVRCQAVSVADQLANGIRFLDIRVQPESSTDLSKDGLILVHGVFPISLTGTKHLRRLLDTVIAFLAANPSETIIISLKREGAGNATDQYLSQILHDHYTSKDPAHWYTEPRIPSLGEARGKIVLMRRFALHDRQKMLHDGRGWCLDAENWAYNTAHDVHGDVCVQDFCEVLEAVNIERKIELCCAHFERAGTAICPIPGITTDAVNPVPPGPLYLNFLSASNFWRVGCWPDRIASRLNPAMVRFLCMQHDAEGGGTGDGGVGVVVCDWVGRGGDWDLVRCIVGMNARLEMRDKARQ